MQEFFKTRNRNYITTIISIIYQFIENGIDMTFYTRVIECYEIWKLYLRYVRKKKEEIKKKAFRIWSS